MKGSFKEFLNEAVKKAKKGKAVAISGTPEVSGVPWTNVPGEAKGKVITPVIPPNDNIEYLSPEQEGNIAAYNAMKAFAMGMENNLSSIVILKSHSTAEIRQAAELLEKDIRAIIQYIMNLQIPL